MANVGDLITADHKVLNEECESRNSHRYAVIVRGFKPLNGYKFIHVKQRLQDVNLETIIDTLSWYKILPLNGSNLIRAKQKTSRETEKSVQSFSSRKPVLNTDN